MTVVIKGFRFLSKNDPVRCADPRAQALVSIVIDEELIINDIRICEARHRLCIEFAENPFPVRKNHTEHIVVPVTLEVRRRIEGIVLDRYNKALEKRRMVNSARV